MSKDEMITALLQMLMEDERPNGGDDEADVFSVNLTITKNTLQGGIGGNKGVLAMFGQEAEDWWDETAKMIAPIMKEQASKFGKIIEKKTGAMLKEVDYKPTPKASDIMEDD